MLFSEVRDMRSKFYLKKEATLLRKSGYTYPQIEKKLGVARGTLSGWLKGLKLSDKIQSQLLETKRSNLVIAQKKSVSIRLAKTQKENDTVLREIKKLMDQTIWTVNLKEFMLGTLYLGEGFKRRSTVALGNSNPLILKVFVSLLRSIYQVEERKFRCYLYLRYDQDEKVEKNFWSRQLNIPMSQFRKTQFDKRTLGKKTWIGYHGVCAVYYYDTKVEKRLTAVQSLLLEKFSQ